MTDLETHGTIVPLTGQELSALSDMLSSGDRAGFYLTYYAMTGSQEALLQSKISTFSGEVGGEAFAANALLQYQYGEDGTEPQRGTYPGIYYLSQLVARSAFDAIQLSAGSSTGVGIIDDEQFFQTAQSAWASEDVLNYFPGNFLDFSTADTPGGVAAQEGLAYAQEMGKIASDYPGSQILSLAGGLSVAVNADGKIVAVFNSVPEDAAVALGAGVFGSIADPDILDAMYGGVRPDDRSEQREIVDGLTEGHAGYNGDLDPKFTNPESGPLNYHASTEGSDDSDLLLTNGSIDGGAGDDVIIGDSGSQTLAGGSGNDIIWGREGVDHIDGGEGDDILRGGAGDDFLTGGAGNDLIDGGDINLNQDADGIDTAIFDDKDGGVIEIDSQGGGSSPSSRADFLLVTRGDEVDTLHSIEKIKLSDGADTLKIAAGADLAGIQEIDAGANPNGTPDVLDLSAFDGKLQLNNGELIGDGVDIKLNNFEKIVGLGSSDFIVATDDTISQIYGGAGNDVIIGGPNHVDLIGGDGSDKLIAGTGGAVLDGGVSNGDGDVYVGGAGADIFVIGNGIHGQQGTDAAFKISNAGANDHLVLRLSDAVGGSANSWTKGIVLTGGVQPIAPGTSAPTNSVSAVFSSNIVQVSSVETAGDGSRVTGTSLSAPKPEIGDFVAFYYWDKTASTLDIQITSAYGDFSVHVDGFENGQLGLNFVNAPQPLITDFHGIQQSPVNIANSWNAYNGALQSLIQDTQLVDLPSAGDPVEGNAAPTTFSANIDFIPIFDSFFNPSEGASVGTPSSGGQDRKRTAFLDRHQDPLRQQDPLVFDLGGSGPYFLGIDDSSAYVDYNGSGFAAHSGWVVPTEGILINYSGTTTIGANTILGAASGDGFADLAQFDSNGDGKVDASDTAAASLRLWVDRNLDGEIDAGEILTLADAGVQSIDLSSTESTNSINGNSIVRAGSFQRSDGSSSGVYEVSFVTDPVLTKTIVPTGYTFSTAALSLPQLDGYGRVADFRYDMSVDQALANEALQLVVNSGQMSGSQFDEAFEHLIQSWAGAAGIDPSAEGPLIDARHLAVVEAFYGQTFEQRNGPDATLNEAAAGEIEATYQSIIDVMKVRFVAELPAAALANGQTAAEVDSNPLAAFAAIDFTPSTDFIDLDFDQLVASVIHAAPADSASQQGYFDLVARVIKALRVDWFGENRFSLTNEFVGAATDAGLSSGWQNLITAEINTDHIVDGRGKGAAVVGTSSDEVILASSANQTLSGNGGSDLYVYSSSDGSDVVDDGGNQSELILTDINSSGVSLVRNGDDLVVSVADTGKTVTIHGQFNSSGVGALQDISFADGTVWDQSAISDAVSTFTWTGSSSNATLTGNDYGTNIFQLGDGSEVANGGARNNVYQVSSSTGQATINLPASASSKNELDFTGGITDDQLWFAQSGNDLNIDLLGTTTEVTLKNWFAGGGNEVQEITAGGLKIDSQVSQLVQAMATYSGVNPGFDPTSASVHTLPNDAALQNSMAAAWHA